MAEADYATQNSFRYTRRTYKKECHELEPTTHTHRDIRDEINVEIDPSPRVGYSENCNNCALEAEGEISNILHKKCPVISLAQQQLQRLLDAEDLICCRNRSFRSIFDVIRYVKEMLVRKNRYQCLLLLLISFIFFSGMMCGAASCGSYSGRFESPVLACLDNLFLPNSYTTYEDSFRCIA